MIYYYYIYIDLMFYLLISSNGCYCDDNEYFAKLLNSTDGYAYLDRNITIHPQDFSSFFRAKDLYGYEFKITIEVDERKSINLFSVLRSKSFRDVTFEINTTYTINGDGIIKYMENCQLSYVTVYINGKLIIESLNEKNSIFCNEMKSSEINDCKIIFNDIEVFNNAENSHFGLVSGYVSDIHTSDFSFRYLTLIGNNITITNDKKCSVGLIFGSVMGKMKIGYSVIIIKSEINMEFNTIDSDEDSFGLFIGNCNNDTFFTNDALYIHIGRIDNFGGLIGKEDKKLDVDNVLIRFYLNDIFNVNSKFGLICYKCDGNVTMTQSYIDIINKINVTDSIINTKIKVKIIYSLFGTKSITDSFITMSDSFIENDADNDLMLLSSYCFPYGTPISLPNFLRIGSSYIILNSLPLYYDNIAYEHKGYLHDIVGLECAEITISPSEKIEFINTNYNPQQLSITLKPPDFYNTQSSIDTRAIIIFSFNKSYYRISPSTIELKEKYSFINYTTIYPKDVDRNVSSLLTFEVISGTASINNYQIKPILLSTEFNGIAPPKVLSCRLKDDEYVIELEFHKKCVMKGVEINKPFKMNDTELLIFDPSTRIDILYYLWINENILYVYYNSTTEEVTENSTMTIKEGYIFPNLNFVNSTHDSLPLELRTPVPQVIDSYFGNDDITVIIQFDIEIEDGIDENGRKCNEIFNDTSFNPSSMCYLSEPNEITMILLNPSSLIPNDELHFIPNIIKSSTNHVRGCEGSISVRGTGGSIQAQISIPKTMSPCYDFVIDGSQTESNRPMIYHWSSTNETLNNILSRMDGPMILIPKNVLEANSDYDISLNVVNTFGYNTLNDTKTIHVGSDMMLNVEIEGDDDFWFFTTQSVYIRGRVSLYQCDKSLPKPEINYNWKVDHYIGDKDLSEFKVADETRLFFDLHSIEYDSQIILRSTIGGLNDSDSIDLTVHSSMSLFSEVNPPYLVQSQNQPIIIDLSHIYFDIMTQRNWACKFNRIYYCDGFYADSSNPIMEISSSDLKIGVYVIDVLVASGNKRFEGTYIREITNVFIKNPNSNSTTYNQNDIFQLICVTSINNNEMKYKWIYSNSGNINPFIGKTDYSKVNVNCENLNPIITHKIILEFTYKDTRIEAFYEFSINESPYNGYLYTTTLNYTFGDNILLSAVGWKEGKRPHTYRFGVIINNSTYYLQATFGLAKYYLGPLPLGSRQYNYTLIPIVFVKDIYGAISNTTLDRDGNEIRIYSPPLKLDDLSKISDELKDVIDDLRNEKYYDYIYPLIDGISSHMKEKNCLNLQCENGAECLDGHCQCLNGFYGELCENRLPIDGGLSIDYTYGECDHKCGKGLKPKWKECNNPKPEYGGKECEKNIEYEECIGEEGSECEDINGNWSEWSDWSECNPVCEIYDGRREYGIERRTRNCTNPKPSGNGLNCIGDNIEIRKCYIICETVRKLCPGESIAKNRTIVGNKCSNNGNCIISREGCKEYEPNCHSKCECFDGYKGEKCEYTNDEYEIRLNLNNILLSNLIESSSKNVLSYDSIDQQSSVLLSIINSPDQFSAENKSSIMLLVKSSISILKENYSSELSYNSLTNFIKSTSLLLKDEWKERRVERNRILQQSSSTTTTTETTTIIRNFIGEELPELFHNISEIHLKQKNSMLPLEVETDVFSLKSIKYDGTIDANEVAEIVDFPDSIIRMNNDKETKEISIIDWLDNPNEDDLKINNRTAGVRSIKIIDEEGEEKKIKNLEKPIYFLQRLNDNTILKHVQCNYYIDGKLQSRGLVVMGIIDNINGNKYVLCATTHLSDFSTKMKSFLPKMNFVNPISDAKLLVNYDKENMIVPIVLGSVILICIVLWIITKVKDMKEYPTLETHKSNYFRLTGRLDDKETDCIMVEKEKKNIIRRYWDMLSDEHSWLSPQLGPTESLIVINRSQRILCLTAQILTSTAVNALFFGNSVEHIHQLEMTSIISCLCMLPASLLIPFVYKYANGYSSNKTSRKKLSQFKLLYIRLKKSLESMQKNKKSGLYLALLCLIFDGLTACFFISFIVILPPGYITLILFCIYLLFTVETIFSIIITNENNKKSFIALLIVNIIIFSIYVVLLTLYILYMKDFSIVYSIWKKFYNGGVFKDVNMYIENSLECCGYNVISDYNTTDCTSPKIMALRMNIGGCKSLLVDKFNEYSPVWITYFVISMTFLLIKMLYLIIFICVYLNKTKVSFEVEIESYKFKNNAVAKQSSDKIKCMLKRSVSKTYYKRKVEYLHLKRQRRVRAGLIILANSFVLLYIIIMVYINLLYGVKFTTDQAKSWIISSSISMIIDIIIQEPVMILLSTVISTSILSIFYDNLVSFI